MLFKELDKLKRTAIMAGVALMFAGLVMMLTPAAYVPTLVTAFGVALVVVALVVVFEFIGSVRTLAHYIALVGGLLAGLAGIGVMTLGDSALLVLSWVFGGLLAAGGIYGMFHTFAFARRSGRPGWWVLVILAAALMGFGTMLFLNPWVEDMRALMQVVGGALVFSSLASLLSLIWIWPIRSE